MRDKQNKTIKALSRGLLNILIHTCALVTCAQYGAFAQNRTIDSLKQLLATKQQDDTAYTRLLVQTSVEYFNINTDSQLHYSKLAFNHPGANNTDRLRCDVITQMGVAYFSGGQNDSALYYYNKSLEYCKENHFDDKLSQCYNNIGNVYLRTAQYMMALSYYDSSEQAAIEADNLIDLVRAKDNKATIFYEQGSYTAALKIYLEGFRLHEEMGNEKEIENTILNLSNVYFRLEDYGKAKQYIARAQEMAKESGSKWSEISCYTTYAMIYDAQELHDSSLYYVKKSLGLSESINNKYLSSVLQGNLAEAYLKINKLDSSEYWYQQTLQLSQEIEDNEGIAIAQNGLGQVCIKRGNLAKGTTLLKQGFDSFRIYGMKEQAMESAGMLSGVYAQLGNFKEAYKYATLEDNYHDSLAKEDALKTARSLEFKYELDKKQAEIELLQKDKDIEASKLQLQRTLSIAAVIGLLLASIIAVLIFRNLKMARNNNSLILQQKNEIEEQANRLEKLNTFKDTTFSVLSHDLRSPINALTGTMSMLDEGIITPEEFSQYKDELNNKLQSVNLMLDNLLQWAKSQMKGEHTLDLEKISIRRKTLKAFAVLKDAAENKGVQLISNVPENLYAHADKNQAEMVMRNIVSNAVKFTPQGGSVTVDAERNGEMIAIKVTDTGIGMSKEQIDKLFDGTPNQSQQGTMGEKGTGIGLQLSYNFVRNNGGNIVVQSQPGAGTTFLLTLPAER